MDSAPALKGNGYGFESLLAGYLKKAVYTGGEGPGCECTGECTEWEGVHQGCKLFFIYHCN